MALAAAGAAGAAAAANGGRGGEVRIERRHEVAVPPRGEIDAANSPSLVRNPRDPRNLALVHRVDRPTYTAALHTSTDSGRTWSRTELPLPAGLDRPFAPDVVFGHDGTLWVSYVNLAGNGNVPDNLWVASSGDGGLTLSEPVRVAGRLAFQARLAAAPDGTLHVTWMQAHEVGLFLLAGRPAPIVAARTRDGGKTFSEPVRVSDAARERVGAASPVIDGSGRLVVLYEDFKDDRRDFQNLEGPPWEGTFALVVTASNDGGRTFSPGVELESGVVPTRRFAVFLPEFPSVAAGRDGRLYVAWTDGRHGDDDVLLRRSGDGGRTWSAPVRVNDNPRGDGTSQLMPRVAVAPGGRVDVVYLDRQRDPLDISTEVSLATSHDGGRRFTTAVISGQAFDSRIGPRSSNTTPVDLGSRLGLHAGDGVAVAAWTDTRFGTLDDGRQDVVVAVVDVRGGPGRGRPALAVALAALALAAAIAALVSGTAGARRRTTG